MSDSTSTKRRRVRGEGSVYQRASDGRWVGVVDLGWVGGKRVRRTVTATTLAELRPKYRRLKQQVEAGILGEDATVAEWMEHWLTHVVAIRNRPSTAYTYRNYAEGWIVPHLGKRKLTGLKPDHVRTFLATMEERGLSDASRRQVFAILRRALVVAQRDGRIATNPATMVDPPPIGRGSHGKLTLAEARQVLAAVADQDDCARWTCALLAGLRQGEALGLRWEDIDFEAGTIRVMRAAQRVRGRGVMVVPTKSDASKRVIPMVAPVAYALERAPRRGEYVFGADQPIDPRRDWGRWREVLELAGVQARPLHAARATTASLLTEARVPPKIISEILGHSQIMITEKHYIHGDSAMHRDAMDALDQLMAPPDSQTPVSTSCVRGLRVVYRD